MNGCRYKRVAYFDTDVGQPEFTPTGFISLHIIDKQTPDLSILYLKKPERCIFFGHVSAKQDSKTYSSCVQSLYDYFRQEFYQAEKIDDPFKIFLPLIINTSGWVKGTGYDILVSMLRHTSPTHVVKVCFSSESKNLPNGLFWLEKPQRKSVNLVQISAENESSYRPAIMRKEARMLRDIRIIAYFRQCLPRDMNFSNVNELAEKLASIPSSGISLSNFKVDHNGCQVLNGVVSQGLNASIVGLGVSYSALTENNTPWCIGLGIVRAVDSTKNQLLLLTPVSLSMLQKVVVIIRSSIDIPACLLQVEAALPWIGPFASLHQEFLSLQEKLKKAQEANVDMRDKRSRDVACLRQVEAGLRADLHTQKMEVDRLREDLQVQMNAADAARADAARFSSAERERALKAEGVAEYKISLDFLRDRDAAMQETCKEVWKVELEPVLADAQELAFCRGMGKALRLMSRRYGCDISCISTEDFSEDEHDDEE